jgi:hypothetical protein
MQKIGEPNFAKNGLKTRGAGSGFFLFRFPGL